MKEKNLNPFMYNISNKQAEAGVYEQRLYNFLLSGKISLKEYLQKVRTKA